MVGAGAPRRAGSSSSNSIYSPRQIFSASFDGETGPTATTFFDSGVSMMGVSSLYLLGRYYCWSANDRGLGSVASPPPPVASPMIILSVYLTPLYQVLFLS